MSAVPDRLGRWERYAPLTGVLAVALWLIGVLTLELGAGRPDENANAEAIASYFEENAGTILGGSFLFMVGCGFFVWFLGSLRARTQAAEDRFGWLAGSVIGTGVLLAAMATAALAPQAAAALSADDSDRTLSPGVAETLWEAGDGFFVAAIAALAVFFLVTAVAILVTRALPGWLGWVTLVLSIGAFVAPVGWAVLLFGLPAWTLLTAIVMWMGAGRAPERDRAMPAAA
jgi:hypothetical protein